MNDPKSKSRSLGRGLSALFGDEADAPAAPVGTSAPAAANTPDASASTSGSPAAESQTGGAQIVPIEFLEPNPYQPRQRFDEDDLQSLVESIKSQGVLQPILVRPSPETTGRYQIIAGERRWRASQLAKLHNVPIVVRELDDRTTLEVALVENIQRQDLNAIEESEAYRRLMDEFGHTQEVLAEAVGKSRSHIANSLRLLSLPQVVQGLVERGDLSAGHARALVGSPDAEKLAATIVKKGLNVRQTERLVKTGKPGGKGAGRLPPKGMAKDADTLALERNLSNVLGLKVGIEFDGSNGTLTIRYDTLEQLDDVIQRLTAGRRDADA